jgi:hypothetical protein
MFPLVVNPLQVFRSHKEDLAGEQGGACGKVFAPTVVG